MSFHPLLKSSLWYGYAVVAGFSTLTFIDNYVFKITHVQGTSMAPTLSPHANDRGEHDLVVVTGSLFGYHASDLRRGDVVVFRKPNNPDDHSVKRVVGLPGDTILRDVRRVGLQQDKGHVWSKERGLRPLPPMIKVPEGSVWVEGDNWRTSLDSNTIGPIPIAIIDGRVKSIVWPPSRFGALQDTRKNSEESKTVVIVARPEPMLDGTVP